MTLAFIKDKKSFSSMQNIFLKLRKLKNLDFLILFSEFFFQPLIKIKNKDFSRKLKKDLKFLFYIFRR